MNRSLVYSLLFGASFLLTGCDFNFGSSSKYAPPPPAPNLSDPPSRVGRLSYLEGSVSLRPSGSVHWTPAVLNRPISSGDELWTDAGGRAEVHLGFAVIRLDSKTDFSVLELSDYAFQVKVTEGVVGIKLRRLELGDIFEIDTPTASVTPTGAGEYRIAVNAKSDFTEVVVRSGEMEVTNAKRAFEVAANQRGHVNRSRLERTVGRAPEPDAFDQFCQARDRREDRWEPGKYVANGVIGGLELEDYGTWLSNAELGTYWKPQRVSEDWAPYRFGRWAWIEPWGWTWIDDAPWGFAPFHYGRWARVDNSWVWALGKSHASPAFAPALVAFSEEKTGVAWVPLAPQEAYLPVYRSTPGYLLRLNAALDHPRRLETALFARQSFVNRTALTAVSRDVFASSQPVANATMRVDARDAAALEAFEAAPKIVPSSASLSTLPPRGVRVPEPPPGDSDRPVVLRRTPLYSAVSFEQRLPALKAHPGQPLDPDILEQMRRNRPESNRLEQNQEPEH